MGGGGGGEKLAGPPGTAVAWLTGPGVRKPPSETPWCRLPSGAPVGSGSTDGLVILFQSRLVASCKVSPASFCTGGREGSEGLHDL